MQTWQAKDDYDDDDADNRCKYLPSAYCASAAKVPPYVNSLSSIHHRPPQS